MDDKKDYKGMLKALNHTTTVAAVLNRLGEIAIETEDDQLKKAANGIANMLRAEHAKPTLKVRLLSFPSSAASHGRIIEGVKVTAKYCEDQIASSQKQWEVLAKRAGWTPPAEP